MSSSRNGAILLDNGKFIRRVSNKFWKYCTTDNISEAKKYYDYKEAQDDLMTISNIEGRLVDGEFIRRI